MVGDGGPGQGKDWFGMGTENVSGGARFHVTQGYLALSTSHCITRISNYKSGIKVWSKVNDLEESM